MDKQEDLSHSLSIEEMASKQLWARQAWASKRECKTREDRKVKLAKLINKDKPAQRELLVWWEVLDPTVELWHLKVRDIEDNTLQTLEELQWIAQTTKEVLRNSAEAV